MNDEEKIIRYLEEKIPTLAEGAVKQAYLHTLLSGLSILEIENGAIVEVFPDGTKKIIKKLLPPIPIKKGQRLEIR